ncbi:MAG: hypothetical protein KDA36_03040, partial [Planctomycetaceae bacterium]|nr:hypothetical protein [Planctomycetaceae bacterium]
LPSSYLENRYEFPHLKFWKGSGDNQAEAAFLQLAKLDRIFGAPCEELLGACMTACRLGSCYSRWILPYEKKGTYGSGFDLGLYACMNGDEYSQKQWLENHLNRTTTESE